MASSYKKKQRLKDHGLWQPPATNSGIVGRDRRRLPDEAFRRHVKLGDRREDTAPAVENSAVASKGDKRKGLAAQDVTALIEASNADVDKRAMARRKAEGFTFW